MERLADAKRGRGMSLCRLLSVGLLSVCFWTVDAGAAVVAPPPNIQVPIADGDGVYTVTWGASASGGDTYRLHEATDPDFSTNLRLVYSGTATSAAITGRSQNTTYYYRVRAIKPDATVSGWRIAGNGCAVPGTIATAPPADITVPVSDADGSYLIAWGASPTPGATYVLDEALDPGFKQGLRLAYSGTNLSTTINGRAQNRTYYYRVRAVKPGYKDSSKKIGIAGCAVPGTGETASPSAINHPFSNSDGYFMVSWGGSATDGARYLLQEATDPIFKTGLRSVYFGTALSKQLSGQASGKTYYYRVAAVKAGLRDSGFVKLEKGCAVPGSAPAAPPAQLTVPASDPDGAYPVTWGASSTPGVTYQLEEATNNTFTEGLRVVYLGAARTAGITGRVTGKAYFYRVRAIKAGLVDSDFRAAANSCLIGQEPGPEPFPTTLGSNWTYFDTADNYYYTDTVIASGQNPIIRTTVAMEPGHYELSHYETRQDGTYLAKNEVFDPYFGDFWFIYNPPLLFVPYDLTSGKKYEEYTLVTYGESTGFAETVPATISTTVGNQAPVTVPAGTFNATNILVTFSAGLNSGVLSYWVVPGVGIVKYDDQAGATELNSYIIY